MNRVFKLSEPSARFFDAIAAQVGATVSGRTTYEHSGHWGGGGPHPTGAAHRPQSPARARDQRGADPGHHRDRGRHRYVSSGRPFVTRARAGSLQAITPGLRLDLLPGRQAGPGDNPYLDTTRLTRDTGFAPAFDIAAAVADYVAWRAGHPR